MKLLFLALVFFAELAAWAAIGVAIYRLAGGGWLGILLACGAVAVAIGSWGLFASPRSTAPLVAARATKVLVFGGSVCLLALAGQHVWALALASLIGISHLGVHLTGSPPASPRESVDHR